MQEDVHDFAWTTSPDYVVKTATFEHPRLPRTELRLLLQPEHLGQAERHFAATRAVLTYYGQWFGPYPYGHLTVIDPAWQSGAGGMEYPTLFTAGTHWLAPGHVEDPEDVTIHEAGHQFWYGLVGNNEFEYAWLDEGLNQFSTARALHEAFTPIYFAARFFDGFIPWVFREAPVTRVDSDGLSGYRWAAESDVPASPSWRYFTGTGGAITYNKTALWLHTLERHIGWPRLRRGLSLVLLAVTIQASQTRGPVCRAVRRRGARSDVVLRSGLSLIQHVRLRREPADHDLDGRARLGRQCRRAALRRRVGLARDVADGGRRAARWGKRCFRSTWSCGSRMARRARALGRPRPVETVHLRPAGGGGLGRGRSQPGAAARRESHQQQPHARAPGAQGKPSMGGPLVAVAAGFSDHVWILPGIKVRSTWKSA